MATAHAWTARMADFEATGFVPRRRMVNLTLRTPEDFYAAAEALVPVLASRVGETERLRRIPDESINDLVDSGVMEMMRPKLYGGAELDASVMTKVAVILSAGCAATSWVSMVYASHLWIMAMLPKEGQDEIFEPRTPVLSPGVFNAAGAKARAVPGGYMLSGRWAFGSGGPHSNWVCLVANIEGRDVDGVPEARLMAVPRPQYQTIDSWHSTGLRGTGSGDIVITDEVFVPEERTFLVHDALEGVPPGATVHEGTAYRLPVLAAFNLIAAAPAIGMGRIAINAFLEKTKTRIRAFSGAKQVHNAAAHIRLAVAKTDVDAAEVILFETFKSLEDEVRAGRTPSAELRARCRMVSGYAPDLCKKAVASVVGASGASASFEGAKLGQALRDITMISSHHTLDLDGGTENYGRVLLGLDPSNPMT